MGTSPLLGSGCADSSAGLPRNRVVMERTHTAVRRRRGTHRSHSICYRARDLRAPPLHGRPVRSVGWSKGNRTTPLEVFFLGGITGSTDRMKRTPQVLAGQGIPDRSSSHQFFRSFSDAVGLQEHLICHTKQLSQEHRRCLAAAG
ncbi:hypothetical protein AVEN_236375-1 [Araneus ventricosus]|uniref:Uncharacterized protein n=1 Tax=Araneus ventricosus TaxID=182803 RepID=A0A4Y2QUG6_ARAVE|nr:hypothetical protein AVEN_236375-1 [Araneus ventricosus]